MNHVTLLGRVTRDPELRYTQGGMAMVRFSVAVDRSLSREKKQEMESKGQPTADFINVVCWGRLAESCTQYTAKGKRVLVQGRIQTGSYEGQDGVRRYTTDVVASSVEFIDWKDRNGDYNPTNSYGGDYAGAYPNNPAMGGGSAMDSSSDGFDSQDFKPVDDERIPF